MLQRSSIEIWILNWTEIPYKSSCCNTANLKLSSVKLPGHIDLSSGDLSRYHKPCWHPEISSLLLCCPAMHDCWKCHALNCIEKILHVHRFRYWESSNVQISLDLGHLYLHWQSSCWGWRNILLSRLTGWNCAHCSYWHWATECSTGLDPAESMPLHAVFF